MVLFFQLARNPKIPQCPRYCTTSFAYSEVICWGGSSKGIPTLLVGFGPICQYYLNALLRSHRDKDHLSVFWDILKKWILSLNTSLKAFRIVAVAGLEPRNPRSWVGCSLHYTTATRLVGLSLCGNLLTQFWTAIFSILNNLMWQYLDSDLVP